MNTSLDHEPGGEALPEDTFQELQVAGQKLNEIRRPPSHIDTRLKPSQDSAGDAKTVKAIPGYRRLQPM
jgi:hypothetical protein